MLSEVRRAAVTIAEATEVVAAWLPGDGLVVAPLGRGLINDTFAVDRGHERYVLQRVHPVFSYAIHDDIAAVTERLAERGLVTPRLVLTAQRERCLRARTGLWRLMTRVPGVTFDAVQSPAQAQAAGALLGRFHSALVDLPHRFVGTRAGVHDTALHLQRLQVAMTSHVSHRLHADVAPLAAAILQAARALPPLSDLPRRVAHGDPKLNNVLFAGASGAESEQAVCMIDLDTVGPMLLPHELGDAWRSWCNPRGEDETIASFDHAVHEASLAGWVGALTFSPTDAEVSSLLHGVEWITLELAARFATDALDELYFGWDPVRFATRGDHNLVRARGQWSLHGAVVQCRAQRQDALRRAFASRRQ